MDAKDDAAYRDAVSGMLATLGDPATRVVDPEVAAGTTADGDAPGAHWQGRTLVIRYGDGSAFASSAAPSILAEIARANSVVFDLRATDETHSSRLEAHLEAWAPTLVQHEIRAARIALRRTHGLGAADVHEQWRLPLGLAHDGSGDHPADEGWASAARRVPARRAFAVAGTGDRVAGRWHRRARGRARPRSGARRPRHEARAAARCDGTRAHVRCARGRARARRAARGSPCDGIASARRRGGWRISAALPAARRSSRTRRDSATSSTSAGPSRSCPRSSTGCSPRCDCTRPSPRSFRTSI